MEMNIFLLVCRMRACTWFEGAWNQDSELDTWN